MKVRIISFVVGGILAVLILLLHKTFVFPLAIAALTCIALFELCRAGKCLHCRISVGAGMLYGAVMPFLCYYGNASAMTGIAFLCVMAMFLEMVLLHKHVRCQEVLFVAVVSLLVTASFDMLISLLHGSAYGLACVILALCSAWNISGQAQALSGDQPEKNRGGIFRRHYCRYCGNDRFRPDLPPDYRRTRPLSLAGIRCRSLRCHQRAGRPECLGAEAAAGTERLWQHHARSRWCDGSV